MKFEIKSVKNGWLLHVEDPEDDAIYVQEERFGSEEECFVNFLRTIIEQFGPDGGYGKRKARNIVPVILPGYSYEGALEKDYIEQLKELRDSIQAAIESQSS
jgi:hypothetical protein